MREPQSNPWRSVTEARLTYALKLLLVIVLAFYVAQFVLEVLSRIRGVVYIFIGAVFLAYLIYPVVQRLSRRVPLVLAILIVYAVILAALVLVGFFIVPQISEDVSMLVRNFPTLEARLHSIVYDPHDPLTSRLPSVVQAQIAKAPSELANWVTTHGAEAFGHAIVLLAGTLAVGAVFIVMPLLTAYLLLDLKQLKQGLGRIVPPQRWQATLGFLADVDEVIGSFIRGQLIVALSVGVLITIALLVLHVPYAFLFGLIAAVGDLIPYVGAVLAFLPAFVSAVLTNGWLNGLLVALAFVAIFEAEGHLIAPNVVGRQVKLSPFIVLLSLLIGAELGGIFGMLVAVPIAGVLRVVGLRVVRAADTK